MSFLWGVKKTPANDAFLKLQIFLLKLPINKLEGKAGFSGP